MMSKTRQKNIRKLNTTQKYFFALLLVLKEKEKQQLTELIVNLDCEVIGCYDQSVFWVCLDWTVDWEEEKTEYMTDSW